MMKVLVILVEQYRYASAFTNSHVYASTIHNSILRNLSKSRVNQTRVLLTLEACVAAMRKLSGPE